MFISSLSKYQVLLIGLLLLYVVKVLTLGAGDFAVYYGAANDIRQGKPIYFVDYPVGNDWCSYSYPPFFALLLMPLSILPLPVADALWLLMNIVLLFRIFQIIDYQLDTAAILSIMQYRLWVFLVLLFTARFILYNFDMSQATIVLLWGCLEGFRLALKNRPVLSGLVVATVISIKLMPLVMLPYFIYRGFFKVSAWVVIFLIVLNLTPSVMYGFDGYGRVLSDWFAVINPAQSAFVLEENRVVESVHSLSSLIPALLTEHITRFGIKRNIFNLSFDKVLLWLTAAQLFFIFLTLFFLKTKPFEAVSPKKRAFWELSYILLITPLIFPHQQKYAFVMLLPAVAFIWFEVVRKTKAGFSQNSIIVWMVIVWLLTTASTDGIVGKQLFEYGQYFKLISWGTILLIIPLSMSSPVK